MFQGCEDHRAIRDKYDGLINAELNGDVETRGLLKRIVESPTFHTCGIVPEHPELTKWHDENTEEEGDASEVPRLEDLEQGTRAGKVWSED